VLSLSVLLLLLLLQLLGQASVHGRGAPLGLEGLCSSSEGGLWGLVGHGKGCVPRRAWRNMQASHSLGSNHTWGHTHAHTRTRTHTHTHTQPSRQGHATAVCHTSCVAALTCVTVVAQALRPLAKKPAGPAAPKIGGWLEGVAAKAGTPARRPSAYLCHSRGSLLAEGSAKVIGRLGAHTLGIEHLRERGPPYPLPCNCPTPATHACM